MKFKKTSMLFLLTIFLASVGFSYTFDAVVTEVKDACSLTLQRRRKIENIKLADILCAQDAETAVAAKKIVETFTLDREVKVNVLNIDRAGNKIAEINLGKTNLSYELVREGYAKFAGADINHPLRKAQRQARAERKGMWSVSYSVSGGPQKSLKSENKKAKAKAKAKPKSKNKKISDYTLKEMGTAAYGHLKKYVDKFLAFLEKIEKNSKK